MELRTGGIPHTQATLVLSLFLLYVTEVEASCSVEELPDGRFTYSLTARMPGGVDYSWVIGNTVIAHEDGSDRDLVLDHGPQNLTTKNCQEKVSHRNGSTGKSVNCSYSCPKKLPNKDSTVSTVGAVVGAVVCAVGAAVVFLIIYWRWEDLKGCFQAWRETRDSPTSQESPEDHLYTRSALI